MKFKLLEYRSDGGMSGWNLLSKQIKRANTDLFLAGSV